MSIPKLVIDLSERAQLERERLARRERLRGPAVESSRSSEPPDTIAMDERRKREYQSSASSDSEDDEVDDAPIAEDGGIFWDQTLRYASNSKSLSVPTISINELISPRTDFQNDQLRLAIFSARVIDPVFLLQHIPSEVPAILVKDSSDNSTPASGDFSDVYRQGEAPPMKFLTPSWLQLWPHADGQRLMNAKYMLLFHASGRLRVIITSANLVRDDWESPNHVVWVQDFPRTLSPLPSKAQLGKEFLSSLQTLLTAQGLPYALSAISSSLPRSLSAELSLLLSTYDYTRAKCHLVASIPARSHSGWPAVQEVGHPGLMRAINSLALGSPIGKTISLEYLSSKIFPYTSSFLRQFHISATGGGVSGSDVHKWLKMPVKSKSTFPFPKSDTVRIVVSRGEGKARPSDMTYDKSEHMAATYWAASSFPKHLLHTLPSESAIGSQSNMIVATYQDDPSSSSSMGSSPLSSSPPSSTSSPRPSLSRLFTSPIPSSSSLKVFAPSPPAPASPSEAPGSNPNPNPNSGPAWMYVGSHTLTPAAWGEWLPTATWFTPAIKIENFELGVVVPLPDGSMIRDVRNMIKWRKDVQIYEGR